jgi:hypothetical protein
MALELYPQAPSRAPSDPLRLAEEYRAYFGQAAIDEFVRTRIRDDAWRPGPLHGALLELPWADVLTTNWDTLLERAARGVSAYDYEPVRNMADLAHAKSPRVVKLHGSIGTSEHFIVAEEDYRTYPVRFAAFVNLARQVFIENELCLLGFSGDDPNFLQWAGWVRDHLGGSARRIYLVDVLELTLAKRKFLEARNVAPIDLAPLVNDYDSADRHRAATELFLQYLVTQRPLAPHAWRPSRGPAATPDHSDRRRTDPGYAATLLDAAAKMWTADRKSYPGWLVCPIRKRRDLRIGSDSAPFPTPPVVEALGSCRAAEVLYEITWRHQTAFWPIYDPLTRLLEGVVGDADNGLQKQAKLEIAAALLRSARDVPDDEQFERWASFLREHAPTDSDLHTEAEYQRCLRARDRLDYTGIRELLERIRGADPTWSLRRAALLSDTGHFSEAEALIIEALSDLRERQRDDRLSLWVRSRRAWAQWLAAAARTASPQPTESWPLEFRDADCDPWEELDTLSRETTDALRKVREEAAEVVPLFDPGTYLDRSGSVRFVSSTVVQPTYTLDRLTETVGVPQRLNWFNLLGSVAKDAAELAFEPTTEWHCRLLRAIESCRDPLIDRYFGRVAVARLPSDTALSLADRVLTAVAFWRSRVIETAAWPLPRSALPSNTPPGKRGCNFDLPACNGAWARPGPQKFLAVRAAWGTGQKQRRIRLSF